MHLGRFCCIATMAVSLGGCFGSLDFGSGSSDDDDAGWTSATASASASASGGGGTSSGDAGWGLPGCDAYAAAAASCDAMADEESLAVLCYAAAAEALEISPECALAHQALVSCVADHDCAVGGIEDVPGGCWPEEDALELACEVGGSSGTTGGSSTGDDGTSSGDGSSTGGGTTSAGGSDSTG